MRSTLLIELLQEIREVTPPDGLASRIVAVDGLGGAGKTTLAERLARELAAPVIHTDDFASWENPLDWWPAVLKQVLEPLAAGQPARFRPASWGGAERAEVTIDAAEFVVLEGVSASRAAFRPYLAYAIWLETLRVLRLARGLARDGGDARALWERWMAAEDEWVERERPAEHADRVLRSDASGHLW